LFSTCRDKEAAVDNDVRFAAQICYAISASASRFAAVESANKFVCADYILCVEGVKECPYVLERSLNGRLPGIESNCVILWVQTDTKAPHCLYRIRHYCIFNSKPQYSEKSL